MRKDSKRIIWTLREQRYVFQHYHTMSDTKLAALLNQEFHGGKPVRSAKSVTVQRNRELGIEKPQGNHRVPS